MASVELPPPTAVIAAYEQERARLVGRIHDDVLQLLGLAGIRSDLAGDAAATGATDKAMAQLAAVREALQGAVERLRGIIVDSRPYQPERESLAGALEDYLSQLGACTGAAFVLRGGAPPDLDPLSSLFVYRFVQSVLAAEKAVGLASVRLQLSARGVTLTVKPRLELPLGPSATTYAEALGATVRLAGDPPTKISLRLPRAR